MNFKKPLDLRSNRARLQALIATIFTVLGLGILNAYPKLAFIVSWIPVFYCASQIAAFGMVINDKAND